LLTERHEIDGSKLSRSVRTVAEHRGARLIPLAESLVGDSEIGQTKWRAWVRKQRSLHVRSVET
jgi:hypothetical protein